MKYFAQTIALLCTVVILSTGCAKEGDFSVSPVDSGKSAVLVPTCRFKTEGWSLSSAGTPNNFALTYDNSGKLQSVIGTTKGVDTIITVATVTSRQIDIEHNGIGIDVIYDFDQDLFTGRPASYTTTHAAVNASSDKSISIQYDASGRISGATEKKKSTSDFIASLAISYDRSGNADTIVYSYGAAGAKTTYSVSGFDANHTPYDSLKPADLLMFDWDLFNAYPLQLIQHLSHNNPLGYNCTPYSGSAFSVTFDYGNLSDQKYPLTITQNSSTDPGNPIVFNYDYDCK